MRVISALFLFSIIFVSVTNAQLTAPESIVWNPTTNSYIISDAANGKLVSMNKSGFIADFTTGLNQPKGLAIDLMSIWVTDLRDIVEIDAETGDILNRYTLAGSGSLNDIVADDFGYLYITDMQNGRVYQFDQFSGTYTIFSKGLLQSPNGIYYDLIGGLIVVSFEPNAKIYSIDLEEGNVQLLMQTSLSQLDGITYDQKRDRYYISSWGSNSIYIFDPSFEVPPQLLRSGLNGPADIYFDNETDTLAVPVMNTGQIVFIGFEDRKVDILGTKTVCEASNVVYKAESSVGYSNKWFVTGGQIQGFDNLDSIVVLWSASGTGKVKLIQTNLQTQIKDSAEISITVNPLPIVNILGNQNTCENSIEKYYAQTTNGVTNSWSVFNGEFIGSNTGDTLTVQWNLIPENNDSLSISGFVNLTQLDNTTGCSNTNSKLINISMRPKPYINGKNIACIGAVEQYTCQYNHNNSYKWYVLGGTIMGNDNDTIVSISWNQGGNSILILNESNSLGCTGSTEIEVMINPLPEKPHISQIGTTLVSSSAASYQWFFEGNPIPGANQQSIMPVDSGTYQVEIADVLGCKNMSDEFVYNPTGVDDNLINSIVHIYPNPANDFIYFSGYQGKAEIFNLMGIKIWEGLISNNSKLDVNFFENGIYFIKMGSNLTKFIKI